MVMLIKPAGVGPFLTSYDKEKEKNINLKRQCIMEKTIELRRVAMVTVAMLIAT